MKIEHFVPIAAGRAFARTAYENVPVVGWLGVAYPANYSKETGWLIYGQSPEEPTELSYVAAVVAHTGDVVPATTLEGFKDVYFSG